MKYRATFERTNFDWQPALHQTSQVIFESDNDLVGKKIHDLEGDDWDNAWEALTTDHFPVAEGFKWSSVMPSDDPLVVVDVSPSKISEDNRQKTMGELSEQLPELGCSEVEFHVNRRDCTFKKPDGSLWEGGIYAAERFVKQLREKT